MATYSNTAREVEMPNGDVVVIHNAPTGGENTTSNIKKFKYDDNGHVTESTAADAEDLNLSGYSTPTTGITAIGTSDDLQTAIGKLDHQSHIDQTNILYNLNMGVKNIIRLNPGTYKDNVATFTVTNDGEVLVSSTSSSTSAVTINTMDLPAGDYVYWYDNTASSGACDVRIMNGSTRLLGEFTLSSATTVSIAIFSYATNSNVSIKPMLCTAGAWAQEPNVYRKPALPNYDLTRLESEDRASLAEVVDSGAKNKINYNGSPWNSDLARLQAINANGTWSSNTFTMNGVTATINSDGTVTTSGTATGGSFIFTFVDLNSATSTYTGDILSGCPNGGDYSTKYAVYLADASGNTTIHTTSTDGVAIPSTAVRYIRVLGRQGTNMNGLTFKPMICTKAAFCVSNKFVPYRPNWDLVCTNLNKLKNGATIRSSLNGNYSYHGFKIKNSRGSGVVCFMGNGYDNGAGVISFSYQTSRDSVYVDKKMTQPSYVKFYHDANAFYIVFFTSTKWDDISLSGTFINESDSLVEEYFSNTEVPSGATQVTETAYPTA